MKAIASIGSAVISIVLMCTPAAPAQTVTTYNPVTGQYYVQTYAPPVANTVYYYDPNLGGTVVSPAVAYAPGPRVWGPGYYYSYSPFYYSPTYLSGYYSYPTYTTYSQTRWRWR